MVRTSKGKKSRVKHEPFDPGPPYIPGERVNGWRIMRRKVRTRYGRFDTFAVCRPNGEEIGTFNLRDARFHASWIAPP